MALSRKNSFPHTIITQTGTLSIVLFGIIIPKGSNENSLCLRRAFVVPSFYLRFCLWAVITPKVEARCIQNGMKNPIHLAGEPY